jgi:hypothetical protein
MIFLVAAIGFIFLLGRIKWGEAKQQTTRDRNLVSVITISESSDCLVWSARWVRDIPIFIMSLISSYSEMESPRVLPLDSTLHIWWWFDLTMTTDQWCNRPSISLLEWFGCHVLLSISVTTIPVILFLFAVVTRVTNPFKSRWCKQ